MKNHRSKLLPPIIRLNQSVVIVLFGFFLFLTLTLPSLTQAASLSSVSVTKSGGGYFQKSQSASLNVSLTTTTDVPIGGYVGVFLPSAQTNNEFSFSSTVSFSNIQIDGADPGSFGFVAFGSSSSTSSYRLSSQQIILKTTGTVLSAGSTVSLTLSSVTPGSSCGATYSDGWLATYETNGATFIDGGYSDNASKFGLSTCTPSVTGTLVDPDGNPVANQYVNLRSQDYSTFFSVVTNANGEFKFFELGATSNIILEAYAPYGADYFDINPITFNIPATASQPYNHGNVSFTKASIIGKVYQPGGATPMADVHVHAHNSNWSKTSSSYTDSEGNFSLGGLGTGTYTVEFQQPWDSEGLISPNPITVSTIAGQTVYYDGGSGHNTAIVFSQANKTITGTVKKGNGTVVTNARVEAYKEMGSGWANTTTDNNGRYSLLVGGGKWNVSVYPEYNGNTTSVDWVYNDPSVRVEFSTDNSQVQSKTVNFTVLAADCLIQGQVVDPDGNTIDYAEQNVYVNVWSYNGGGNGSSVDSGGLFSFYVPTGTYELSVDTWSGAYGSPARKEITVKDADNNGSCDGYNAGKIKLLRRNSSIKGKIVDNHGNAIANNWVNAWRVSNHGWADTTTDSSGNYTLNVTAGTWVVSISSDPGMMSGGYSQNEAIYIYDGNPIQVTVAENETKTGNNFTMKIADATINGRVVDKNGNTLTDLEMGYAFIEIGSGGYGPMMYSTIGAPVQNGTFTLKVPAGNYNVNVDMPSDVGYCTSTSKLVTVNSGSSAATDIPVVNADATITGYLKDGSATGDTITGVRAEVFGNSGNMNYAWDYVDESKGSYSLSVCPGDWFLSYWINSDLGYLSHPMGESKVTVSAGETKTKNIVAKKADAVISGTVKDPDGNPLTGAWVSIDTRSNDTTGSFERDHMYFSGNMTNSRGEFNIEVPSGTTYYVEAHLPGEYYSGGSNLYNYINPKRVSVTPQKGQTVSVGLQFKQADATLQGQVTQSGSAKPAFVTGWSEEGGYSSTYTDGNGNYSLPITASINWHIRAIHETGASFARSNEIIVNVESGTSELDLNLANAGTMPDSVSATFSATNQKTITLSDGTTINIPSGALASSGNVTVTIEPKAQLPSQSLANPISFGYEIKALDANGTEITSNFNSNVTIIIPYSEDDLSALGLTEDDLLAGYWDSSTSSWRVANNITVDQDNDTVTLTVNHFTDFALFSAGASLAQVQASSSANTTTTTSSSNSTTTSTITVDSTALAAANGSTATATPTPTTTPTTSSQLPSTGVKPIQALLFYVSWLISQLGKPLIDSLF